MRQLLWNIFAKRWDSLPDAPGCIASGGIFTAAADRVVPERVPVKAQQKPFRRMRLAFALIFGIMKGIK